MKKLLTILVAIIAVFTVFKLSLSNLNSDIIDNLEGEIYYLKRVDGVSTIFKSDANLNNEELIYSHIGKGKTDSGDNDNILDFYYDSNTDTFKFVAMNDGEWSIFSLDNGVATFIENGTTFVENNNYIDTDYLKLTTDGLEVSQRKGSIYLSDNGKEECIKKFYGIYDDKFTGYRPIGLSPDGKYLIYRSNGHLTPIGSLFDGLVTGDVGHTYIMDLSTGKSTRYKKINSIQWLT